MVCKFVSFEVIILTSILILPKAVTWRCSEKRCSYKFCKIHRKPKSLLDWLCTQERLCFSWLTNLCEGMCLFMSWLIYGLLVLSFYDMLSPVWCSDTTLKNTWRSLRWQFQMTWTGQIWNFSAWHQPWWHLLSH